MILGRQLRICALKIQINIFLVLKILTVLIFTTKIYVLRFTKDYERPNAYALVRYCIFYRKYNRSIVVNIDYRYKRIR